MTAGTSLWSRRLPRPTLRPLGLLAVAALGSACTQDEPNLVYAAPITLTMTASSADTTAGDLSVAKSIRDEAGSPYAVFLVNARGRLERDPRRIDVSAATLGLAAGSVGVTGVGEVFEGATEVALLLDSGVSYPAAAVDISAITVGEVKLTPNFTDEELPAADLGQLTTGAFKVVLHGTAAPGFDGKGAEAHLKLTLTFEAYP